MYARAVPLLGILFGLFFASALSVHNETKRNRLGPFSTGFVSAISASRAVLPVKVLDCKARLPSGAFHAKMSILTTDQYVGRSFGSGRWWEEDMLFLALQKYTDRLQRSPHLVNILDLGANMGAFTVPAASEAISHGGFVWAFEPQKAMFSQLSANVFINGLPNVNLYNAAAVHRSKVFISMAAAHVDGASTGKDVDATGMFEQNFGGRKLGLGGESVLGVALDSLSIDNVGLMKVDVQGADALAFFGAKRTIKKSLPVIMAEKVDHFFVDQDMVNAFSIPVSPQVQRFDYIAFCKRLGYTVQAIPGHRDEVLLIPPDNQ